jgi:hypothetical protein
MRLKSLELNWIRNVDKSLVMPEVVFSSIDWCGGFYHEPKAGEEVFIDGNYYPLDYGLIEVSESNNPDIQELASTIAHEWRHHWQICHGYKTIYSFIWPRQFEVDDYDGLLVNYFTKNHHEMDALLFQRKYASIHDEWEKLLYNHLTC